MGEPRWASYLGPTWVTQLGPTWVNPGGLPMWFPGGYLMGNLCKMGYMGPFLFYQI